jgi:hypothetical protein
MPIYLCSVRIPYTSLNHNQKWQSHFEIKRGLWQTPAGQGLPAVWNALHLEVDVDAQTFLNLP